MSVAGTYLDIFFFRVSQRLIILNFAYIAPGQMLCCQDMFSFILFFSLWKHMKEKRQELSAESMPSEWIAMSQTCFLQSLLFIL